MRNLRLTIAFGAVLLFISVPPASAATKAQAIKAVKGELENEYSTGRDYFVKCTALTSKRFKCGWTVFRSADFIYGGTARVTRFSKAWDVTLSEKCNSRMGDHGSECFDYSYS